MQPGKQLHITDTDEPLSEAQFVNVRNDEHSAMMKKPMRRTGLWTSTWHEETQESDWVDWCRCNEYGSPYKQCWYLFTPKEDAKLYVIDGHFDLLRLLKEYSWETAIGQRLNEGMQQFDEESAIRSSIFEDGWVNKMFKLPHFAFIDFERLAQEYDGIWLTEQGNGATHLSYPHDLNGWDAESVLWFRWCFTRVERIETPVPVAVASEE